MKTVVGMLSEKWAICIVPQHHLRETGLGYLFPRVELYLQEPDQDLARVSTHTMDGEQSMCCTPLLLHALALYLLILP